MANNKITIGSGGKKDDSINKPIEELDITNSQVAARDSVARSENDVLDEIIWGNDYELHKKLDKDNLTEKRRYIRVRFIQRIECKMLCEDKNSEPENLEEPLVFTAIDISVGGIGAVSEAFIEPGIILYFTVVLDHFTYDIKSEVIYCVELDDKYRIGLKVKQNEKEFIRHLKIFVAKLSLEGKYRT